MNSRQLPPGAVRAGMSPALGRDHLSEELSEELLVVVPDEGMRCQSEFCNVPESVGGASCN